MRYDPKLMDWRDPPSNRGGAAILEQKHGEPGDIGYPHRVSGWHGRRGTTKPSDSPVLYLAPNRDYADEWSADETEPGAVYWVDYDADNPLVVTDAAEFRKLWEASGASEATGSFHPNATGRFADHLRGLGYDAVVLTPEAFEGDGEDWEVIAGTFGDPQTIILNPKRAKFEQKHGDPSRAGYELLHPGPDRIVALLPTTHQPAVGKIITWGFFGDEDSVVWHDDNTGMTWEIPTADLRVDGKPASPQQLRERRLEMERRLKESTPTPLADLSSPGWRPGSFLRSDHVADVLRERRESEARHAAAEWSPLLRYDTDASFYEDTLDSTDTERLSLGAHALYDMDYTAQEGTEMAARVTSISTASRGIGVKGAVWAKEGDTWVRAGEFERVVDRAGELVDHDLFRVGNAYQGKGFGEAFVEHSELEYREAGIETIFVAAGLEGGGYAWARQGFDWDWVDAGDGVPTIVADLYEFAHRGGPEVNQEARRLLVGFGIDPDDSFVVGQDGDEIPMEEAMAERMRENPEEWPTPYEIAMLGYDPAVGHGIGETWPGKQIMRGSAWNGRKDLTATTFGAKWAVAVLARGADEPRSAFLARVALERRREMSELLAVHGSLGDEAVDWSGD